MSGGAVRGKLEARLGWIARLTPGTCPGGVPSDERDWRELVNRIVRDVRGALAELSDKGEASGGLLPSHGGYRKLRSFQVASLIYDGTQIFCGRFVSRRSRTHDQMVQAARSGRQNIAEGSVASGTSKKGELKLTSVARASLEELRLDYEDYLRQHRLRQWAKDDPEAIAVRGRYRGYPEDWFEASDPSDKSEERLDPYGIAAASAEVAANTLLCLIHQAIYLLRRQLEAQGDGFLEGGGFTERLYRKRQEHRANAGGHAG